MRNVGLTFTDLQIRLLQKESADVGMSMSEIVRRLLDHYFIGKRTSQQIFLFPDDPYILGAPTPQNIDRKEVTNGKPTPPAGLFEN